jgi:hypothetical protein
MELRKFRDFSTKTMNGIIQYRIVKITEHKEIMLKSKAFPSFDKVLIFIVNISMTIQILSNKWYTRMH